MNPQPAGRDWYVVDWIDVWDRKRIAPHDAPGVQLLTLGQHLYRVHRTHLATLGFDLAASPIGLTATHPPAKPALWVDGKVVLRPHQVEGIDYIRSRRGTLLADEQRVGKSPQIMFSHEPDAGPLVIVGPLAARAVWHEWAARRFGECQSRFTGRKDPDGVHDEVRGDQCSICTRVRPGWFDNAAPSFVALSGRKFDPELLALALRSRVIFLHFAIVPTWRQLFAELSRVGTFAVDEAHLSGVQNRKGIFFESIRFLNTIAERAILATGTPLLNKPSGLWPMLDVLTPGAFGKFWDYARRYCDAKPGAYGWSAKGATNQEELRERLREVMIRRTWAEISPSLPPITRTLEVVRLDDAKRDHVEELAARIRSQTGNAKTVVGDLARLRKLYANEKASRAIEWAKEQTVNGQSVIVWTWHREIAERIVNGLRNVVQNVTGPIHGDMSPDGRELAIECARDVAASRPVVLVATMAALGTAVNLSFAPHELTVELDWNPHVIAQAEMRPFDGINRVTNTILVADCDVEQKLADALLGKLAGMDALGLGAGVGSVESVLRESLGVEDAQTLSALADAVMMEAA